MTNIAPHDDATRSPNNPQWFRQVLGRYPTGVCAITAMGTDGKPVGMAVGSFTSVSLTPPLVAFLPDKGSTSWPKIEQAGAFCVNVLGSEQRIICKQFASKGDDKYAGLAYTTAVTGSPVLAGVAAWIDCDIQQVIEAGDHYIVIGAVRALDLGDASAPLLFHSGTYGSYIAG